MSAAKVNRTPAAGTSAGAGSSSTKRRSEHKRRSITSPKSAAAPTSAAATPIPAAAPHALSVLPTRNSVGAIDPLATGQLLRTKHIQTLEVLSDYEKRNDELSAANRELSARLKALANTGREGSIQSMDDAKRIISELQTELTAARATINQFDTERAAHAEQLTAAKSNVSAAHSAVHAQLLARNEQLQDVLTAQAAQVKAAQAEQTTATAACRESEKREAALKATASQHAIQMQALTARVQQLQTELATATAAASAAGKKKGKSAASSVADSEDGTASGASTARAAKPKLKASVQTKRPPSAPGTAGAVAKFARAAAAAATGHEESMAVLGAQIHALKQELSSAEVRYRNAVSDRDAARAEARAIQIRCAAEIARLTSDNASLSAELKLEREKLLLLATGSSQAKPNADAYPLSGDGDASDNARRAQFSEFVALKRDNERLQQTIVDYQKQLERLTRSLRKSTAAAASASKRSSVNGSDAGSSTLLMSIPSASTSIGGSPRIYPFHESKRNQFNQKS